VSSLALVCVYKRKYSLTRAGKSQGIAKKVEITILVRWCRWKGGTGRQGSWKRRAGLCIYIGYNPQVRGRDSQQAGLEHGLNGGGDPVKVENTNQQPAGKSKLVPRWGGRRGEYTKRSTRNHRAQNFRALKKKLGSQAFPEAKRRGETHAPEEKQARLHRDIVSLCHRTTRENAR